MRMQAAAMPPHTTASQLIFHAFPYSYVTKCEIDNTCYYVDCVDEENDDDYALVSKEKNCLFKWIFHAIFRTGLWEVELYTIEPVYVTAKRRPCLKEKQLPK